jgi:Domain of unknown function (DUF305)
LIAVILIKTLAIVAAGIGVAAMSSIFRLSVGSHLAAIAVGAVAATAYLTVHSASPQSLADYISAIRAKTFGSAPTAEAPYLAENVSAMTKMMINMGIKPSGDVDTDFVAMMVPHHRGAIEMAQAELRYGQNEPLRRMAQEIIVTQLQEITAMQLSLGQPLPPSAPSPDQIPPAAMNDSKSGRSRPARIP